MGQIAARTAVLRGGFIVDAAFAVAALLVALLLLPRIPKSEGPVMA